MRRWVPSASARPKRHTRDGPCGPTEGNPPQDRTSGATYRL